MSIFCACLATLQHVKARLHSITLLAYLCRHWQSWRCNQTVSTSPGTWAARRCMCSSRASTASDPVASWIGQSEGNSGLQGPVCRSLSSLADAWLKRPCQSCPLLSECARLGCLLFWLAGYTSAIGRCCCSILHEDGCDQMGVHNKLCAVACGTAGPRVYAAAVTVGLSWSLMRR
jgi:hypothetical protein